MLDTLRAWINGNRDYNTGVLLYKQLGTDDKLKVMFSQGYSLYRGYRLQEELIAICDKLKQLQRTAKVASNIVDAAIKVVKSLNAKENGSAKVTVAKPEKIIVQDEEGNDFEESIAGITDTIRQISKNINIANPELFEACRTKAGITYKEAMNPRALLFSMIPANEYEEPNRPDLVAARLPLALEVVTKYNLASRLYDDADYVKVHGKLPDQNETDIEQKISSLKDHEVKPALDNARKAYNKIKNKEQTPARIILIQNHLSKIKALEERWHSLKPLK